MEFIALPVKKGDSFLLKNEGKNYVIDGGISETAIVNMVKKEINNQSIQILVCTHYDKDHINGVIGLINSDIDINEIWLPSIFARAFRHLDEYSYLFKEDNSEYEEEINEEILSPTGEYASEEEEDGVIVSVSKRIRTYSWRAAYWEVLKEILPRIEKLLQACNNRKGISTIRWFKYNHWHKETIIKKYPLIGLNCKQVKVIKPYNSIGGLILDLTLIN